MHSYHRADRSTKRFTVENRRIFLLPITLHGLRPVLSCHSYTFESVFALLTRSLRGWSLKDSLEEVAREKTCFSVRDASVRGHLRLLSTSPPPFFFSSFSEDSLLKKCFNTPPPPSCFSRLVFPTPCTTPAPSKQKTRNSRENIPRVHAHLFSLRSLSFYLFREFIRRA